MTARDASNERSDGLANAAIEDKMAKLCLGKAEPEGAVGCAGPASDDSRELTADEADALQKLLAADREGRDGGDSADKQGSSPDATGKGGTGKAKEPGQRQPRLERQVFVGGLPVDVTSSLFRTWADQVFHGRVINAVLVVDRLTHSRSRGFGFITFDDVEVAEEAARQRMFSFGERMVEIKRAQNLSANRNAKPATQTPNQVADAKAKYNKPQLNGRSSRFNVGRGGGMPPYAVGGSNARGASAPQRGLATRPVSGQLALAQNPGALSGHSHQYPGHNQGKMYAAKGGTGNGVAAGMGAPAAAAPNWSGPPCVPGPGGRGNHHFHPSMGPDSYTGNMDGVPVGARHAPGAGSWFPGMTPEQQMMAAGGYAYFYPVYPPQGRGGGMVPSPPPAPHGPYAPPWPGPMSADGMMPPFMPGAPPGLFYGSIPPGMEMMMGMHPSMMMVMPASGMPDGGAPEDYEEPTGQDAGEDSAQQPQPPSDANQTAANGQQVS